MEQGDGTFGSSTEQVTYEMYVVTEALLSLHSWGRSTGIDEVLKLAATKVSGNNETMHEQLHSDITIVGTERPLCLEVPFGCTALMMNSALHLSLNLGLSPCSILHMSQVRAFVPWREAATCSAELGLASSVVLGKLTKMKFAKVAMRICGSQL